MTDFFDRLRARGEAVQAAPVAAPSPEAAERCPICTYAVIPQCPASAKRARYDCEECLKRMEYWLPGGAGEKEGREPEEET